MAGEPEKSVFLSYSSEDAGAARRIRDALESAGLEVWLDENELRGGDAWDASIRRQIRECSWFVPIVSAGTEARREGYFRLEWKLAVDRSHLMAEDRPFILPVAIDATPEATARVPDRFREVQWSRVQHDRDLEAFVKRMRALADGAPATGLQRAARTASGKAGPTPASAQFKRWMPIAAVLAIVAIAVYFAYDLRWRGDRTATSTAGHADTRMAFAVIPVTAAEGDRGAARFADALTEALIARQANSPWSRVVSRESVQQALRGRPAPRDLGAALQVRYLLRGHVGRRGEKFVAALSVVDARSEQVLGSEEVVWPPGRPVDAHRREIEEPMARLADRAYRRELAEARRKPQEHLDARDLAYLANDAWNQSKAGYDIAMSYLRRAMTLAPEDPLVLALVAKVNLCECRNRLSRDPREQERIGTEAVEKSLARHPRDRLMLFWKIYLNTMYGRYEDSLVIIDRMLETSPGDPELLAERAYQLNKLGRVKEALEPAEAALRDDPTASNRGGAAVIHFKLGNDERALELIRLAIAEMTRKEREDPWSGAVLLVRIAAAANLGRADQVKLGLDDFRAAAPGVDTIAKIRRWMDPRSGLAGHEPLFGALRKAGIPDEMGSG